MGLLEQYDDTTDGGGGGEFKQKIIMALSKKSSIIINQLAGSWGGTPSEKSEMHDIYISFIKELLEKQPDGVTFVARILAANNINNDSDDSVIQTAIDNYFDALSLLFDPSIGV